MTPEQTGGESETERLRRSTAALRDALSHMDAAALTRRPAPDEWNCWDIAYHVAQIEVWYVAKLCEAVSAGAPEAAARFLGVWSALREAAIALAEEVPSERLDRAGLLSGVPDWTPRELIQRIADHDEEHAAQARVAAAVDAPPPAGHHTAGSG